jgi:transcription termination/antitermination protein NusG
LIGRGSLVKGQTKGGEALQRDAEHELDRPVGDGEPPTQSLDKTPPQWYALYTRSHCEQLVYDQLIARGFSIFLPKMDVWSRRGGIRHRIPTPMFPGYLFLRHAMDKISFIEVCKARGLVRILGERWDRLSVVPEGEIEAIQRVLRAELPVISHPYLREGQRVRITDGPLMGVEGILVQSKPSKGLLVLSIELLRRSIAVEVDATVVGAA